MNKKRKNKMVYRYYEMPFYSPVLILSGAPSSGSKDSLHFHNHLEIGYCYEGEGSMILGENEIPYHDGTFTIIPKNFPHMTLPLEENRDIWKYLIVDTDAFFSIMYKENPYQANQLTLRVNSKPYLSDKAEQAKNAFLIEQIFETFQQQQDLYHEEIKGLLLALLIDIAQSNKPETKEAYQPRLAYATIISPALDYISLAPERPIKIEDLAAMCHVSEAHFRRIFVECMKISPAKYINQVRIRRACDELQRTDDSINAIAARTGFSTLSTFNRNFRQITGTSPQQLRRQSKQHI